MEAASRGDGLLTEKLMALSFSLLILAQAWLVRRIVGTWLVPACIFGLFWFALSFAPLVMLFTVPVDPLAVGFILLCAVAFSAGSLPFNWKPALRMNEEKREMPVIYGSGFLKTAFYASVATSLALIVLHATNQGFSKYDLVFRLFATAEAYARLRYADDLTSPLLERWSIVAAYLGVIIGGLRFSGGSPGGRRLTVALAFLPSVLIALTQSATWPFLLSIAYFYSGILVYRISSGTLHLVGRDGGRALALYAATALLVVVGTFMSRGAYNADASEVGRLLAARFASYTSGHLYAFSDWFAYSLGRHSDLTYNQSTASHGFYTFATLFKLLGSQEVLPLGVYDDGYAYGGVLVTNVFTMFRGLITDFGHVGAVLFMSVVGVLFHGAFYSLLSSRRPVLTVALFIYMMGFFFSSFVVSMFGSNIIYYVTFVLTWVVLVVDQRLAPSGAVPHGQGSRAPGVTVQRSPA